MLSADGACCHPVRPESHQPLRPEDLSLDSNPDIACSSSSPSPLSVCTASRSRVGLRITSTRSSAACAAPRKWSAMNSPSPCPLSACCSWPTRSVCKASSRLRPTPKTASASLAGIFLPGPETVSSSTIIGFICFFTSAIAETNRAPFDLPEAESELVAGFHTEYASFKFAMFFIAEYTAMITVSCLATILFSVAGSLPSLALPPGTSLTSSLAPLSFPSASGSSTTALNTKHLRKLVLPPSVSPCSPSVQRSSLSQSSTIHPARLLVHRKSLRLPLFLRLGARHAASSAL